MVALQRSPSSPLNPSAKAINHHIPHPRPPGNTDHSPAPINIHHLLSGASCCVERGTGLGFTFATSSGSLKEKPWPNNPDIQCSWLKYQPNALVEPISIPTAYFISGFSFWLSSSFKDVTPSPLKHSSFFPKEKRLLKGNQQGKVSPSSALVRRCQRSPGHGEHLSEHCQQHGHVLNHSSLPPHAPTRCDQKLKEANWEEQIWGGFSPSPGTLLKVLVPVGYRAAHGACTAGRSQLFPEHLPILLGDGLPWSIYRLILVPPSSTTS